MKPALDYIESRFAHSISLKELSTLSNISPFYFSRYFKKATGVTLTGYIHSTRINKAKQMLISEPFTITEIAEKTGFCDVHYFGRVFRAWTGVAPTTYRNEIARHGTERQ
ncbi:helix-turn-helix domain-containing protein [Paenibacillus hodogayensis]|uniref:Helix-turn-helix domain-containing protein n=1 Tax=Paenibacillus hodogayensis TaxID=279208 RepID=A0ABV5VP84_9BACL